MYQETERRLGVQVDHHKPSNLFAARKIDSLRDINALFWNKSGRIYLSIDAEGSSGDIEKLGASADRHGVFITPDSLIDFDGLAKYLPFVARRVIEPIVADLIPSSSWGSSLANLLTRSNWNEFRAIEFQKTSNRCTLCGTSHDLECHEIWEYHEPIKTANLPNGQILCGVQKLLGLISVCSDCHETFHLGFAKLNGRLDQALSRIAAINRWNHDEVRQYYNFIGGRFQRRSQFGWVLDLSIFKDCTLSIAPSWKKDSNGWLSAKGKSETMLLGVQWKYPKDISVNAAISPDCAYYE